MPTSGNQRKVTIMRKLLIAGIAVLSLAACTPSPFVKVGPATSVRCTEDMACWDCETMGNQICGKP